MEEATAAAVAEVEDTEVAEAEDMEVDPVVEEKVVEESPLLELA